MGDGTVSKRSSAKMTAPESQIQEVHTSDLQTASKGKTTISVTIDNSAGFGWVTKAFKTDTPEGYNSNRRFVARWVLWGVVFGLVRPRLLIAMGCSAASIVILKEGTIFSGKNLKWMILAMLSLAASLVSWSLIRAHDSFDEDRAYVLKMLLRTSSKSIRVGWAMI